MFYNSRYLEGYLTANRIQQHRCNMFFTFFGEDPQPAKVQKFSKSFPSLHIQSSPVLQCFLLHASYRLFHRSYGVSSFLAESFMEAQDRWTRKMIRTFSKTDPLWRHMEYVTAQFDGLVAGYQVCKEKRLMLWVKIENGF